MDLKTKQVADALGISESTIKRWCDSGRLRSQRTLGGHRRISKAAVVDLLRSSSLEIKHPHFLDLPNDRHHEEAAEQTESGDDALARRLADCLVGNEERRFRHAIIGDYLRHSDFASTCDRLIKPAFQIVGSMWETGLITEYQERRACDICEQALHRIANEFFPRSEKRLFALGASPETDNYRLATLLCELSLRAHGYSAESLGHNIPLRSLSEAVRKHRPKLVWLSVSFVADPAAFEINFCSLVDSVPNDVGIVVGGVSLETQLPTRLAAVNYGQDMKELVAIANRIAAATDPS